jgi:ferric-dicitrate binding protein FerR (iron transport regulator)
MEHVDTNSISRSRPSDEEILSRACISWKKTREEAWEDVSASIRNRTSIRLTGSRFVWAVAASLAILISTGLFMSLYTKSFITAPGEERTITFSDGSITKLSAQSELSYHPLIWKLDRKVKLNGEGYFEVIPGNTFSVISEKGITTVLGTKFSIFARQNRYEVSCVSGKVKVESTMTDDAVILHQDEKAWLNTHGKLDLDREQQREQQIDAKQSEWTFTNEPLQNVIRTLEDQYGIKINLPAGDSHRFTGGFDKAMPIQNVLDLVCTPFGYTFTEKSKGEFEIHPK